MKLRFFYLLFAVTFGVLLLTGYSGGPAASARADFSGSPIGTLYCGSAGCHSAGTFQSAVKAELLDDDTPVTVYEPGESYTLRITISTQQGNPAVYGFQTVALAGENNVRAGTLGSPPDGFRVIEVNGLQYAEHTSPRDGNVLSIEWTAPPAGTGEVRFYAGGNAANGNGTNSGDSGARLAEPLVIGEAATSVVFRPAPLEVDLQAFPNPVRSVVNVQINGAEAGTYLLRLVDLQGRLLSQQPVTLNGGENSERIDLSTLPAGPYVIQLTDNRRVASRKILKW